MRIYKLPSAALIAIAAGIGIFGGGAAQAAGGNADVPEGGPTATDPSTAARSADHDGFVVALRLGN